MLHRLGLLTAALTLLGAAAWAVTYAVPGARPSAPVGPRLVAAPVPAPVATPQAITPAAPAASPWPVAPASSWVADVAASTGISPVAVTAYGRAVLTAPSGCAIGWTTLAGIGWVESHQGTIGGRYLEANGRPSTAITGPPLAQWAPALGPMQFLPVTWEQWGRDGDGDGVADPQDIDDAAVAAVAYLCGTGQDLTTGAGWSAAIFAYNHSDAYVRDVYAAASTYASRTAG